MRASTLLGVERERCRIVPLGYDPALFAAAETRAAAAAVHHVCRQSPSAQEPRRALRSVGRLARSDRAGSRDHRPRRCRRARSATGAAAANCALRATSSDAHLVAGYRAASAYVHPALAEGFGLPMLEAMVAGNAGHREHDGGAGDPRAVRGDVCAARYARVARGAHRSRGQSGAVPAPRRRGASRCMRAYTWDRFAAATAAVYREVVDGSSRSVDIGAAVAACVLALCAAGARVALRRSPSRTRTCGGTHRSRSPSTATNCRAIPRRASSEKAAGGWSFRSCASTARSASASRATATRSRRARRASDRAAHRQRERARSTAAR